MPLKTVLVVEDDPIVRLHVCDALEDNGFAVLEAERADDAISIIANNDEICLVISDVRLPGSLNGLQLVRHIEDHWPEISTVLASGLSEAEFTAPAGTKVLRKPFGMNSLLSACRSRAVERSAWPSST